MLEFCRPAAGRCGFWRDRRTIEGLEVIMALKLKDLRFIDLYFANGFNATQALIDLHGEGHYADRASATSMAYQILQRTEVKAEVDRRYIEWRARNQLTIEQFGQQLQDAIHVDVVDFFYPSGEMKPLIDIPPHARKQISSIEFEEIRVQNPITDEWEVTVRPKLKLWDRRRAEELWGKWKKMYTDKVEAGGPDGGPVRVSFSIVGLEDK